MKRFELKPSKRWVNKETGRTASIYGSLPYYTDAEAEQWEVVTDGYTIFDCSRNICFSPYGVDKRDLAKMEERCQILNERFSGTFDCE